MKHKPDQALGHREVFLFLPRAILFRDSFRFWGERWRDRRGAGRAQRGTGSFANSPLATALTLVAGSKTHAAGLREDRRLDR
jgi:hypothetical protein